MGNCQAHGRAKRGRAVVPRGNETIREPLGFSEAIHFALSPVHGVSKLIDLRGQRFDVALRVARCIGLCSASAD